MKNIATRTIFFLLSFILPFALFAQIADDPDDPTTDEPSDFVCPVSCDPCDYPFARYLAEIYSSGWGPVYDVPYSITEDGVRTFDYYSYGDECPARPLVVILPGSGFVGPGPIKTVPNTIYKAKYFAKRGYAVAVVDYYRVPEPCATQASMNTVMHKAAQDVNAALQYLVANAANLNIDPGNIFMIGESAGGIAGLSAIFSGMDGQLLLNELQTSNIGADYALNAKTWPPFKNVNYCIKAFAGISTGVPTEGMFDNRVRNVDVPMSFVHGIDDLAVPFGVDYPHGCSGGTLANPFCGSGCIVDKIKNDPQNVNCYKMYEVDTDVHDLMSVPIPPYQALYMDLCKTLFYEMMYCAPCKDFQKRYVGPLAAKNAGNPFPGSEDADQSPGLFPNPVDAQLNIRGVDPGTAVTLTNLVGKVVLSTTLNQEMGTLDVSELTPGVYLVTLTSKGVHKTEKIVIE